MVAVPRGESSGDRDDRDYLDHVAPPIEGWSEYYRILGGYCAFTVPTIVDCTARSRADLPQRYHGNQRSPDHRCRLTTGGTLGSIFKERRLITPEFPTAMAFDGTHWE
jgi:hypothetical protein